MSEQVEQYPSPVGLSITDGFEVPGHYYYTNDPETIEQVEKVKNITISENDYLCMTHINPKMVYDNFDKYKNHCVKIGGLCKTYHDIVVAYMYNCMIFKELEDDEDTIIENRRKYGGHTFFEGMNKYKNIWCVYCAS